MAPKAADKLTDAQKKKEHRTRAPCFFGGRMRCFAASGLEWEWEPGALPKKKGERRQ